MKSDERSRTNSQTRARTANAMPSGLSRPRLSSTESQKIVPEPKLASQGSRQNLTEALSGSPGSVSSVASNVRMEHV